MILVCSRCGSTSFQPSRLRLSDLSRLLRLQLPARCRSCKSRRYAPIGAVRALPKVHHRASKPA